MTLQEAQKKARFGHSDWVGWNDKNGAWRYERKSPEVVKAAMLAHGTKGGWLLLSANSGTPMRGYWWMGVNLLAWMKRGVF